MLQSFQSAFRIPELRNRILFTLGILVVFRVGTYVTIPGIDPRALDEYFSSAATGVLGFYDMFAGGAFGRATVFALGIMPYISASIILQLMGAVIPFLQKLQKEGEEGRKKITQYTRYGTVALAAAQSFGVSLFMESLRSPITGMLVVPDPGLGFRLLTILTITAGTVFVMWLGEQIDDRGIGNGMSMLIFIGIIARAPAAVIQEYQDFVANNKPILLELFVVVIIIAVTALVVLITQGTRKIPVQYAKRVVGRRVYGGQSTHIPLKVNTSGVMPIIFAQAIMFLPSTLANFFPMNEWVQDMASRFSPATTLHALPYWMLYSAMIIFFAYFYTAIVFNPVDLADNMKRQGGFIPGIRPGRRTSDFIDRILTRITLPGSIFLAAIAVFPFFVISWADVNPGLIDFFGGTGLLIIVGVALDTLQRVESHLLMRHYDGFMKKGRLRGRR
ncbi:MAG: preprotein translocase subunit SecY [Gemmatimonadota bacterium]|nr:preprotein translocase subunit SecY [Gemmatimonadota bacterium]